MEKMKLYSVLSEHSDWTEKETNLIPYIWTTLLEQHYHIFSWFLGIRSIVQSIFSDLLQDICYKLN